VKTIQELAESIVGHGVGRKGLVNTTFFIDDSGPMSSKDFVNDPRVAMAMLGKLSRHELIKAFLGGSVLMPKWHLLDQLRDPHAINAACDEALSDG